MLVRVPPMSVEPSTSVTLPSGLTLPEQLDASPTLNQKPAAMPRPRFVPTSGVLPVLAVLGRLQALTRPIARIDGAIDAPGALLGRVLEAELDRVDAQLLGQLVDDLLAGEGRLRGPRRPVGLGLGLVVDHVEAINPGVWQVVATEDAHGTRADHPAGKGSAVVSQPGFAGRELALLRRAELDADERARRGAGCLEDLVALHDHLHRPAALAAQEGRDRFQVDGDLASEAAADLARDDQALRDGNIQQLGHLLTAVEGSLGGRPDLEPVVLVPERDRGVRLDVTLMNAGRAELALHDEVGLRKPSAMLPFSN